MTDTTPDSIGALVERVRSAHMYLADRMVEIPEDLRVALLQSLTDLTRERDEARAAIINSPETADFMAGVPIEAAHQRERWGVDHDAGKSPFDWFWLIGFLSQKAADAAVRGDVEKAKHHTISTAAALANWHAVLSGKDSRFQPGITPKPAEMTV